MESTTYFSVMFNAWGTAIERAIQMKDDTLIDTLYDSMDYYDETDDLSKVLKAVQTTNKKYWARPREE